MTVSPRFRLRATVSDDRDPRRAVRSDALDAHCVLHAELDALCARLAEAAAEKVQRRLFGEQKSLRVAFGYATCPDHSLKRIVFDRMKAEHKLDITLTDHYSIQPSTAICGLFINHPEARYFPVGHIDEVQFTDYCQRRGISLAEGERLLSKHKLPNL